MKLNVKYLQEGGAMPAEDPAAMGAPAPEQGGAPAGGQEEMIQQLAGMAQQIIQEMGPDAAAMLAQIIMEMLQGGGAAPAPEAQPAFQRMGGRIVRVR